MAQENHSRMINDTITQYVQTLRGHGIPIWRLYLFGSHAKGTAQADSDIDLAVFLDQDEIDGFNEDVQLMRLTRKVIEIGAVRISSERKQRIINRLL